MESGIQQSMVDFKAKIEAILFACGEPIEISKLANTLNIPISALREQLEDFSLINKDNSRGVMVVFLDDKVQLVTKPKYINDINNILIKKNDSPLSQASLETLVIIAYNQPVSKAFIEKVRGVNSYSIVNNLIDKGLVEEAGRLDIPGKPVVFKTTDLFLRSFSLSSLDDLPSIDDSLFEKDENLNEN